jgi:hypothetical protein
LFFNDESIFSFIDKNSYMTSRIDEINFTNPKYIDDLSKLEGLVATDIIYRSKKNIDAFCYKIHCCGIPYKYTTNKAETVASYIIDNPEMFKLDPRLDLDSRKNRRDKLSRLIWALYIPFYMRDVDEIMLLYYMIPDNIRKIEKIMERTTFDETVFS